jgi:hypothetical protein
VTDPNELLAQVDYWLEGGIPPMGCREMVVKLRAALATRPELPTNDKIADAIAHALRTAASGQRHVHAAHHGCEGCARAATAAVVRLLTAAGSATPEEDTDG